MHFNAFLELRFSINLLQTHRLAGTKITNENKIDVQYVMEDYFSRCLNTRCLQCGSWVTLMPGYRCVPSDGACNASVTFCVVDVKCMIEAVSCVMDMRCLCSGCEVCDRSGYLCYGYEVFVKWM